MNTENQEKVIVVGTPSHQYNALCSCPDCQKQRNGGGHNWWDVPEQCNQLSAQIEILTRENKSMASVLIKINEYCQLNNIGKIGDSAGLALITHCKELAATVEALRKQFSLSLDMLEKYLLSNEHLTGDDASDFAEFQFCLEATPQQHLRDVRAEAGRAGFVAAYMQSGHSSHEFVEAMYGEDADQYAERVRAGEK